MKKLVLIIMVMVGVFTSAFAQDTIVLYITDHPATMELCTNKTVLVYAEQNCNEWYWRINNVVHEENPIVIESLTQQQFNIQYYGCMGGHSFTIIYWETSVPSPYIHTEWKRQGYTETIEPVGVDSLEWYNYQWSTGETTSTINVVEPGTYTCEISDYCGSSIRTFIVKDNVEIELATCDLITNLNMVTWPTNVAQAEYVDHLIVKRDGVQVATANYSDGYFLDDVGSDAAQRTYTLIAVAPDGTQCPIESNPKETIHMSYLLGVGNTVEVGWNTPTGYDLLGYNICEWHEDDGSLTVIDYVGASVTSYTCSQSQFDQGYIVVQGVEAGKDGETRLLSNRSMDLVGLGENEATTFKVYPNPAKDRFTVEGSGTMTITNALGQTLLTREIDGKTTIELTQGLYFVKLGETMRKVVVE